MSRTSLSLLLLGLLGCQTNTIDATIDGEPVDVKSGIFVQERGYYNDEEGLVRVIVSDVGNPCEAYTEWYLALASVDLEDVFTGDLGYLEDVWAEEFPEDFWDGEVWMRVDDPRDDLTDEEFTGEPANTLLLSDAGTSMGFLNHYTDHLSLTDLLTGDDRTRYPFDGGALTITRHEPDERIVGSYLTTVTDSDDVEQEVTVVFDADRCEDLEDAIEELGNNSDNSGSNWWDEWGGDWDTGDWGGGDTGGWWN